MYEWAGSCNKLSAHLKKNGSDTPVSTLNYWRVQHGIGIANPAYAKRFCEEDLDDSEKRERAADELLEYFKTRTVPAGRPSRGSLTGRKYAVEVIGSDLHAPLHHEGAWEVFLAACERLQPDGITLNGDVLDLAMISRFVKRPKAVRQLQTDLDWARENVFARVNAACPNATKTLTLGNHEGERWERYLWERCPEISELRVLSMEALLGLAEMGWCFEPDGYELIPDTFMVEHGDRHTSTLGGGSAMTARKEMIDTGLSGLSGHCFSEDTEILTPEGWCHHSTLKEGTIVLTMDTTGPRSERRLTWEPVQAVYRYTDYTELIRVQAHGLDLLVTPEHGLLVPNASVGRPKGRKAGIGWERKAAQDLYGTELRAFPLAGHHDEECLPLSEAHIRVIAWVMAEGHVSSDRNPYIRIAQSDYDGHLGTLENDLAGAKVKYTKTLRYAAGSTEHGQHRNYDAYRYNLEAASSRWVFNYITTAKSPTTRLRGMSHAQMVAFLDAYVTADGCVNKESINARQIASNRHDHIDFLQELAVRTGHRSSVCERPGGMLCLTINGRDKARTHAGSWSREPYSGTVWCVTVPAGTVVVRRNGRTAIACNTHRLGKFWRNDNAGYRVWLEGGCLCDQVKMREHRVTARKRGHKKEDWHLGFAVVYHRVGGQAFEIKDVSILTEPKRTFCIIHGEEIAS